MARFSEQYLLPALRGMIEAEQIVSLCVEDAIYNFCGRISKELGISPHVLHSSARDFLSTYKEPEPVGVCKCRAKTKAKEPCPWKPLWHGFCKTHQDQYTKEVRQMDRMRETARAAIMHIGHNPGEWREDCPGCAAKGRPSGAQL